ncbi:class I SAM-dependent methyltransferase [Kribbella ginsengisoli]|uniref:Methyltransferase domain-containing protein n=1 Tax=Kribbella ginsengisoli TaxID=363865 RepID=A0ABP6YBJ8_9ACTN
MVFDAVAYKATTRQQWDQAAEAWHRWGPTLEEWLGESTEAMLEAAAVRPGSRVLDVAGGAGGQALAAARRTGSSGSVLVTDLSLEILAYAERAALENGLRHVTTAQADGEDLGTLWSQEFDAVICRLGLIYFPNQMQALHGIRSTLREGGRFAAIVYSTADRNAFFSVPVSLIRERAGLGAPLAGQPGPFSLGDPSAARSALIAAGFKDVSVRTLDAPLRLPSAADCVRFEKESFGALHQMLSGVPEDERTRVWADIERALGEYDTDGQFVGPCELHVLSGTR